MRLLNVFIRAAFQQEAAFRTNFAVNLLNTALNVIIGVAGVMVLYSQVDAIQGWTFPQTLALVGVYLFIGALRNLCFGPSLDALGGMDGDIWQGRFDFTLLKPASTQFLVSCRHWRVWAIFDLGLSFMILGKALLELRMSLSLLQVGMFLVTLLMSITIVYALLLVLATAVFWYQGVPLIWIFSSVIQMGRYPIGIYPGWIRLVLTWIVPVGFITTVPVEALSGRLGVPTLLGGIGLTVGLFLLASYFFQTSLRRYASASS
jgi:ABC-2 type transport system permease protein